MVIQKRNKNLKTEYIMKTKLIHLSLLASLTIGSLFAQEKLRLQQKNSDISDNLDLRAVATVLVMQKTWKILKED